MKKMLKNSKGFTLVELLAVIVVLAVIILIAMPAVMSSMDKARKNALLTEVSEITKVAQTAYASDSMGTGITEICYNLDYLVKEGYLDKNLENYTGEVFLSIDNGVVTASVDISNGIYRYAGDPRTADADKLLGGVNGAAANNNCQTEGTTNNKGYTVGETFSGTKKCENKDGTAKGECTKVAASSRGAIE